MRVNKKRGATELIPAPGYYPLTKEGWEKPEPSEAKYYPPDKEKLQKAILAGKRAKLRLMFGTGLLREWQKNPELGGKCWAINADMDVLQVPVRVNYSEFTRPYKNFMTFLTKKDALRARALITRVLRDVQAELYGKVDMAEDAKVYTNPGQLEIFQPE